MRVSPTYSHIFPNGRLLLGFGIVACGAEGFSGNGADGASPSKMALGRHRRVGKIMDGKIIFLGRVAEF
jgi:hypothetical protein